MVYTSTNLIDRNLAEIDEFLNGFSVQQWSSSPTGVHRRDGMEPAPAGYHRPRGRRCGM